MEPASAITKSTLLSPFKSPADIPVGFTPFNNVTLKGVNKKLIVPVVAKVFLKKHIALPSKLETAISSLSSPSKSATIGRWGPLRFVKVKALVKVIAPLVEVLRNIDNVLELWFAIIKSTLPSRSKSFTAKPKGRSCTVKFCRGPISKVPDTD